MNLHARHALKPLAPGSALTWSLLILLAVSGLTACDIQPVAVGSWQIEIGDEPDTSQETWTITEAGQIRLQRGGDTETTDVELAGSRVSWTLGSLDPQATDRINFSGTVDGNRLSGTLYSQQGNRTVTGSRLQQDR